MVSEKFRKKAKGNMDIVKVYRLTQQRIVKYIRKVLRKLQEWEKEGMDIKKYYNEKIVFKLF